ncbi:MAG: sigma-54-dependent Fis family transcriptional regulator [Desulfobacteraceae bacterium]|nr:sigma-54-dependent Fis family transcriptional regulator [Desulfobacteraceae bacterium]
MAHSAFSGIIGQSREIKKVFSTIERVAPSNSTILISGETGTGKGLAAKAIHETSQRAENTFVSINCGAIPENLLESELFGHVKGAFTGAISSKTGKFERAHQGTIFLDEIGDMSPDLQVKILRVLEEKEFEQVGGTRTIKVDIRVIAATHRNLEEQVEKGLFREDLFYRLYVIPINMPPLRKRMIDIPLLSNFFLNKFNAKNELDISEISKEAISCMAAYGWPGNVRELQNLIERIVVLKQEGEIEMDDLPEKIRSVNPGTIEAPYVEITDEGMSLNTAVTEFEKALILQSLEKTRWVKNKAAKLLNLKRTTLVEKIKRHQLVPPDIAMES